MQNRAKLSGIAINTTPFEDHMHGAMFLKKVDLEENKERGLLNNWTVFLKGHKYDYKGLIEEPVK